MVVTAWAEGTPSFRGHLGVCCAAVRHSRFGQLIGNIPKTRRRKTLGPPESFCFEKGCRKKTGLIKIGLIWVGRSHSQGMPSDGAGSGGWQD